MNSMKTDEAITMTLNIAGQKIYLRTPFDKQNEVRETESHIGDLLKQWKRRFPEKSDNELLAMIAYQYASYYLSLYRRQQEAATSIAEIDSLLDASLKTELPA